MESNSTVIKLLRESAAQPLTLVSDDTLARATTLGGVLRGHAPTRQAPGEFGIAAMAVDHAQEGIVIIAPQVDDSGPRILYANSAFCRMTGMTPDEVVGQPLRIFRTDDADRAVRDALLHPLCQRKPFEGEAVAMRKNGTQYAVELLLVPVRDDEDQVVQWIAYLKDITQKKAQMRALERQALHDVLTDLPNRTLFLDRADQAILRARGSGSQLAILMMDLDGFKEVNDSLGHHAGDLLLQQVAKRIREDLDSGDTVARLGGDEFAFVLSSAGDVGTAMRMARRILKNLERPFLLEDRKCEIGASLGVSIFPDHGVDAATVMRHADTAMYHAKRTGIGASLFTPERDSGASNRMTLSAELREAIEQGQLRVYYQPKIHLRSGVVTRAEALVRWQHPERGLIVPDEFIPLAERSGLIKPLTEWVLNTSLQQCAEWQREGLPIHLAVNLSARVLQEDVLPQTIAAMLERWNVDPRSLKLEITESSIIADPQQAFAILTLLQTLGVRLSLDDFGTGYSSLMHLRELPFDEIKIDKSFVMGMAQSAGDEAIVRATIELAHNLGRQVVAEGVDDPRTCKKLVELGCDLAQGYAFSPPLPARQFEQWLAETGWGFTIWRQVLSV